LSYFIHHDIELALRYPPLYTHFSLQRFPYCQHCASYLYLLGGGRVSLSDFLQIILGGIGLLVAVISIFVSIEIYRRQKNCKELTWSIVSNAPVVTFSSAMGPMTQGQVKVLFGTQPVANVYLVVLTIKNSGNVSIQSSDYEKNCITCGFKSGTHTLDVKMLEPQNPHINNQIQSGLLLDQIVLEPMTLNEKEEMTFRFLLDTYNTEDDIKVSAKLIGGKIRKSNQLPDIPGQRLLRALDFFRSIALITCAIISITVLYSLFKNINYIALYISIMSIVFVIYVAMVIMMKFMRDFIAEQEKARLID
jgi:hypothetical protein